MTFTNRRTTVLFAASIVIRYHAARAMSTSLSAAASSSSSSLPKPKAAVVQLTSTSNKFSNLVKIARCAAFAKQQGASMLFLPECFGFMGSSATETLENAEIVETTTTTPPDNDYSDACRRNDPAVNDILISLVTNTGNLDVTSVTVTSTTTTATVATIHNDGSTTDQEYDNTSISLMDGLRTIAQASNLWISGGGIHEYIDGTSVYNTHIILNDKGHVICKYRKVHLFDVCIPDRGVDARESRTTTAGDKSLVVCDSPLGILGLTICYDMRFPEQYTALVQRGGAQIMLMPSAFMVPTGQAHWHVLLRARAIETQCYVIAAAQVGRHNEKRVSYGHAVVIDPWGVVVADAGEEMSSTSSSSSSSTVIVCDVDLDYLADVRLRMPIQAHRDTANQGLADGDLE